MSAIANITAGSRILASAMAGIAPLAAEKPTDQSVTSSTTLVNDTALLAAVAANATYLVYCYLDYEGGTGGSSDLKFQWTVPASATMRFTLIGTDASNATLISSTKSDTTVYTLRSAGAATLQAALMVGSLVVAGTSGTLQLQWAQNTSSGTATKVHAQSFLSLWRVS